MLRSIEDLDIQGIDLTSADKKCLDFIQKDKNIKITDQYALEWLKCRSNPLYFIQNYVYLEETGGMIKFDENYLRLKQRRVIRVINRYHKCVLMASRQLGKSTISACILAWSTIFFPNNKAIILNFKKDPAIKNLAMVKFIIDNLPDWLKWTCVEKSKSERITYLALRNGSRIDAMYPSSTTPATTVARSLTASCLYIDEAAFIRHMGEVYGSAQPVLFKATEQAIKNNYPYFQLVTSTPNGIAGGGEWFYKRWEEAVDSDDMFALDENDTNMEVWKPNVDLDAIANDPNKNSFIRVRYHWSEDPSKSERWYQEQKRTLSDQRKVNQELDLIFVGTSHCIFDDDLLSKMNAKPVQDSIYLRHGAVLKLFKPYEDIDPLDYYLIGVDTARSLTGAFNAIQIFSFKNFEQVAELSIKTGSFALYGEIIHDVFQWLYQLVGQRIILCIENNTIGLAPIEHLTIHIKDFDYTPYIYWDSVKAPGISTTGISKDMMVGCFKECIQENSECVSSQDLINQMSSIERRSSGGIGSNVFSDLFMAACFCAYTRKQKALEIMPLISLTNKAINKNFKDNMSALIGLSDPKQSLNTSHNMYSNPNSFMSSDMDYMDTRYDDDSVSPDLLPFMPFFGS